MQTDKIVWIGDCRTNLAKLHDNSINCIVTSPPYLSQRVYGGSSEEMGHEESPGDYIANLVSLFEILKMKLHPRGSIWVNIGETYARAVKGGKHGQGVGCGRNILFPNRPQMKGFQVGSSMAIPERFKVAIVDSGLCVRQSIVWNKVAPKPGSQKNRCTNCYEMLYHITKSDKYNFNYAAIREKATTVDLKRNPSGMRTMHDIWNFLPERYSEHPAPFPKQLPQNCIRMTCKPGDLVVDPFHGSGTTGNVASEFGCNYVGFELYPKYTEEWGECEIYEDKDCA